MKKLNKKLVSKIVLLAMITSLLVLFTACEFSSSSIDAGLNLSIGAFETTFNGLVNGIVGAVRGLATGIWQLVEGLCTIVVGLIAWVYEAIMGLF